MIMREGNSIVLTGETSTAFLRSVMNPEQAVVKHCFSKIYISNTKDGFIADVPDFIVPEEIEHEK